MKLPIWQDDNERPDLCGPCGGRCCQTYPGASYPQDWGQTEEEIASNVFEALCTGRWAIDWWEGDVMTDRHNGGQTFYLRPAVKSDEGEVFDASYGGPCTFHSSKGCEIFGKRPTGCRALIPDNEGCYYLEESDIAFGSKKAACMAWYELQELLEDVGKRAKRFWKDEKQSHAHSGTSWLECCLEQSD